jgi:hypothetical protein
LLLMPNFTEWCDKDRAVVPRTSLTARGTRNDGGRCPPPPRTSNVVIGVGLAIASPLPLPLPWMLLLALQPCRRRHRSCHRHQCPLRRPPPSPTLVAVTITIRGCTQEFPATKSKKLIKVPRMQQSKKQKVCTNEQRTTLTPPPPNRRFPISTHQAEIDPQVNITQHSCCSLPALATLWHVGVGRACHYVAKIYPQGRFYPQKSTCTAIFPPK